MTSSPTYYSQAVYPATTDTAAAAAAAAAVGYHPTSLPPLSQLLIPSSTTATTTASHPHPTNILSHSQQSLSSRPAAESNPVYPATTVMYRQTYYGYENDPAAAAAAAAIPLQSNTTPVVPSNLVQVFPAGIHATPGHPLVPSASGTSTRNSFSGGLHHHPSQLPSPPPSCTESLSPAAVMVSDDQQNAQKVFSFVPIPGVNHKKRPRRKYHEVERLYHCSYPGCTKAYGTLNHLNAHVSMQNHVSNSTSPPLPHPNFSPTPNSRDHQCHHRQKRNSHTPPLLGTQTTPHRVQRTAKAMA
ncbi:hypothetical protein BX666DRAFT_1906484 [Dichotomocladium elegans]|nr:hypothetical protein BX666DRAFT_1906484 [Dichotomocladium elegans]